MGLVGVAGWKGLGVGVEAMSSTRETTKHGKIIIDYFANANA